MTTKITIKPHLAEYLIGKFPSGDGRPVAVIPSVYSIYWVMYDLLSKRPDGHHTDHGNLEIALPSPRRSHEAGGKPVLTYNYISERGAKILEHRIDIMMKAELHDLFDENKHIFHINYIETAYYFTQKYGITSISIDALIKSYQRYRRDIGRRTSKRLYRKK